MTYRTEAEEAEARGTDVHEQERAGVRPKRSDPWIDPTRERDLYLEALGEKIAGLRYELQEAEAEYEQVQQWRPEPAPLRQDEDRPGYDPRLFGWREQSEREAALHDREVRL